MEVNTTLADSASLTLMGSTQWRGWPSVSFHLLSALKSDFLSINIFLYPCRDQLDQPISLPSTNLNCFKLLRNISTLSFWWPCCRLAQIPCLMLSLPAMHRAMYWPWPLPGVCSTLRCHLQSMVKYDIWHVQTWIAWAPQYVLSYSFLFSGRWRSKTHRRGHLWAEGT